MSASASSAFAVGDQARPSTAPADAHANAHAPAPAPAAAAMATDRQTDKQTDTQEREREENARSGRMYARDDKVAQGRGMQDIGTERDATRRDGPHATQRNAKRSEVGGRNRTTTAVLCGCLPCAYLRCRPSRALRRSRACALKDTHAQGPWRGRGRGTAGAGQGRKGRRRRRRNARLEWRGPPRRGGSAAHGARDTGSGTRRRAVPA